MTFSLDPGAGMQRIIDRRGTVLEVDRLEHGFHYSWLPTAEYRERFGHAAYARAGGTRVSLVGKDSELVASDDEPLILDPGRAELVALPDEVLEAGIAYVSSLLHPRAAFHKSWRLPDDFVGSDVDWPAESGGPRRSRRSASVSSRRL